MNQIFPFLLAAALAYEKPSFVSNKGNGVYVKSKLTKKQANNRAKAKRAKHAKRKNR